MNKSRDGSRNYSQARNSYQDSNSDPYSDFSESDSSNWSRDELQEKEAKRGKLLKRGAMRKKAVIDKESDQLLHDYRPVIAPPSTHRNALLVASILGIVLGGVAVGICSFNLAYLDLRATGKDDSRDAKGANELVLLITCFLILGLTFCLGNLHFLISYAAVHREILPNAKITEILGTTKFKWITVAQGLLSISGALIAGLFVIMNSAKAVLLTSTGLLLCYSTFCFGLFWGVALCVVPWFLLGHPEAGWAYW